MAIFIVALFAILVSCAPGPGSNDSIEPTVSTDPGTTPPAAARPTTSATEAPTSPTTIDEAIDAEEAAVAAVMAQGQAWLDCMADPDDCRPESTFLRYSTGPSAERLTEVFEEWRASGWSLLPPIDPAHDSNEVFDVDVRGEPPAEVSVIGCVIDGFRVVELGGAADGSDVIIDGDISSTLYEAIVVASDDGRWRVSESRLLAKDEGDGGCVSMGS